jgi:hypothetical protein
MKQNLPRNAGRYFLPNPKISHRKMKMTRTLVKSWHRYAETCPMHWRLGLPGNLTSVAQGVGWDLRPISINCCQISRMIPARGETMSFSAHSYCLVWFNLTRSSHVNASLIFVFCAAVNVRGNLTATSTIKLPRSLGFLLIGMPKPGNFSS